jgi:hypothetical protein
MSAREESTEGAKRTEDGGMSACRREVAASEHEGDIIRAVLSACDRPFAGKSAVARPLQDSNPDRS